jgi:preprotein translocase subunit YajC
MTSIFVDELLAMGPPPPGTQPNPTGQMLNFVGMMVLFIVVMYVMMIRPQQKKAKEHAALLKALRPKDKVVTSGGITGVVVSVQEKTVTIRSADTKLEVLKSAVTEITERASAES